MKAKAGISRLVVLFIILVLPVSAMAWSIGDIDFDLLGERIDIKINPVNQMKATMIHRYPDPIKVVIIMASRCGQGNKICVDNIYYIKDDMLNGYRSIGGKYEIEALAPERAMDIYNEIMDYIGKLSALQKQNGWSVIANVPNESVGSENHIDLNEIGQEVEHVHLRIGPDRMCRITVRYPDPEISIVRIYLIKAKSIVVGWRYFKNGEHFLFLYDRDILQKFGRIYYVRSKAIPNNLEDIRNQFNRFKNPI